MQIRNLEETDRKIERKMKILLENKKRSLRHEDRLKVAPEDEHFGIKSAIPNHKSIRNL